MIEENTNQRTTHCDVVRSKLSSTYSTAPLFCLWSDSSTSVDERSGVRQLEDCQGKHPGGVSITKLCNKNKVQDLKLF